MEIWRFSLLFFVYSFLGWGVEVAYAAHRTGRFVNRGFLNGPFCPIYGFGALGAAMLLQPVQESLLLLFACSALLATIIEFLTGLLLEKLFKTRWWDYSDRKFNFKGYVCLHFSLLWGLVCAFVVRVLHPALQSAVGFILDPGVIALTGILAVLTVVDILATLAAIRNLGARLRLLTELAAELRELSDAIGETISDRALDVMRIADEGENWISDGRAALAEKYTEAEALLSDGCRAVTRKIGEEIGEMAEKIDHQRNAVADRLTRSMDGVRKRMDAAMELPSRAQRRLLEAFPGSVSLKYQEALESLRRKYGGRKNDAGK